MCNSKLSNLKVQKFSPGWHFVIATKIKENLEAQGTDGTESWSGHKWSYAS
jgi:hypothetical protein